MKVSTVHIDQQLMAHTEGCCVANANLFSSGIQRRQRKRVFQHNNPRFHGLVGVGGQLLGVVGELPAAGFALEALLPTQNPLANENGILVAAARTGIRLNLGQLLIQRQKALDRLADLIFLVFAELFQNRLLLSVGHLCRSLALDDPIVHRMLSHKWVKSSL